MKDVAWKQRELARLHVLNNVLEYQIPIGQAAEILGVSERHARRLLGASAGTEQALAGIS